MLVHWSVRLQGVAGASFVIVWVVMSMSMYWSISLQGVVRASFIIMLVVVSGVGALEYLFAGCGKS